MVQVFKQLAARVELFRLCYASSQSGHGCHAKGVAAGGLALGGCLLPLQDTHIAVPASILLVNWQAPSACQRSEVPGTKSRCVAALLQALRALIRIAAAIVTAIAAVFRRGGASVPNVRGC